MILDINKSNDNRTKYTATLLTNENKIVHIKFGAFGYSQFHDLLKKYKDDNNNDVEKLKNYYERHNIDHPKYSADWLSKNVLWPLKLKEDNLQNKPKKLIIKYLNTLE